MSTKIAERVTVNLTQKSSEALANTSDLTGDTKTEVINKALQLYALIQRAQADGGETQIKEGANAVLSRVRFY